MKPTASGTSRRMVTLILTAFLGGVVLAAVVFIVLTRVQTRNDAQATRQAERDSALTATAVAAQPATPEPTGLADATPTAAPAGVTVSAPTVTAPAATPTALPQPTPVLPTAVAGSGCAAPTVACTALGAVWAGGDAVCRADGSGYDVAGCRAGGEQTFEVVKPAERDPARWGNARCNDGSPFGFQVRLSPYGPSDTWVIMLEGGGWCDDDSKACFGRTATLTSSNPVGSDRSSGQIGKSGIFNLDVAANPTFHNANHVFAPYCSSDLWSGTGGAPRPTQADPDGWYFAGRANFAAMIETLQHSYGLEDGNSAEGVLLVGTSAGGLGVEANADQMTRLLPQASAAGRVKLIDDGGFLLDWDNPDYRLAPASVPVRELMIRNYEFWGSALNPVCEQMMQAAGRHPGNCFMTQDVYPTIVQTPPNGLGLPLLIQVSGMDQPASQGHGITNPDDPADRAALMAWREQTLATVQRFDWVFSNGGRPYHTLLPRDDARNGWTMGEPPATFRTLVTEFWTGAAPQQLIFGYR